MIIKNESLFKIIQFKPKKVLFKKHDSDVYAVILSQTKIWLKIEVENFDFDNVLISFEDINDINALMFDKIEFKDTMVYFDDVLVLKPRFIKKVEHHEERQKLEHLKKFLPHELVKSSYLLNRTNKIIVGNKYVNIFSERLSVHYPIKLALKYSLEILDTNALLQFLNISALNNTQILFTVYNQGLIFYNKYDIIELQCKIIKDIKEYDLTLFEYYDFLPNGFLFNTKEMLKLEVNSKGTFLKGFYWMYKLSDNLHQVKSLYFNSQTLNDANFLIPNENNTISVIENGLVIKSFVKEYNYFVRLYEM